MRRAYEPIQVEQCELSEGLATIHPRRRPDGWPYAVARVLVRLHTHPLGSVDVPLPPEGLEPVALERLVEDGLGERVRRHLARDGAPGPDPPCQAERRAVLEDPPTVTVVVPTRDRPDDLRTCLEAVLASDYPDRRFDVLVADNAPPDSRTRDMVERHYGADDRVSYLVAPRPGSGSARNDGAAGAAGDLVAFVDDDALVDRVWLAELVTGFRAAADVSCVGGLVLAAELDTWAQQLFEEYGGLGKRNLDNAVLDLGANRPPQRMFPFTPGSIGAGANVAFRRGALLEAGGYDPYMGNGTPARSGEDWELLLRLLRHGHTLAYRPGAIVHHAHRRGFDELRKQIHDYGVGMGAALMRTVVHEPAAALEIVRRLPSGAYFLLSSRSSKNIQRSDSYPRELRRAELAGLARGPAAYLRSRRAG